MLKKILVLITSLYLLPAHAALETITFNLLNDASSVKDPIKITDGYIEYVYNPGISTKPESCVDKTTIIPNSLPIIVGKSSASKISIPITSDMTTCLQNPDIYTLVIILYITKVDGKTKIGDFKCAPTVWIDTQNSVNAQETVNIRETTDTFYCSYLNLR